ncbi:MAG: septation protein IspZ [Paracoccaceae bacterium]|nr:septation protein IspZ [Paracoccaceae bacterium]MDE2913951.1 septation protein IspZ [Paracoccaceae bacterium]
MTSNDRRQLNGLVRFSLDLGPVILFFLVYTRLKDQEFLIFGDSYSGFIVATALFVPVLLVATGIHWILTGRLSRMQLVVAVIVILFGGLSIWLNDERFFKMKPTIVYLLFGGVLGFGLMRGRSYLEYVMDDALPLNATGWNKLTWRLTVLFLGLAAVNELVWRLMSTDSWVNFKTFVLPAAIFVFFIAHAPLFARYSTQNN